MQTIVYSTWGGIHFVAALLSLMLGTMILVISKEKLFHKKIGYLYLFCMAVMISSAFGIYRQYKSFRVFHVAAILTLVTLLAGMLPLMWRKKVRKWLSLHYGFMYLSVLELYIALVAEFLVRIPQATFWGVAITSSALVLIPGSFLFFYKCNREWNVFTRKLNTISVVRNPMKRAA